MFIKQRERGYNENLFYIYLTINATTLAFDLHSTTNGNKCRCAIE